jgi:ribosome biogenesis GTPase
MSVIDALGWDDGWTTALGTATNDEAVAARAVAARVVAAGRDVWQVVAEIGALEARVSGRLRGTAVGAADLPAVGDWVVIDARPDEGAATIVAVLPRRTALSRTAGEDGRRTGVDAQVLAANVDVVFVVAGLDDDLNLARLERYLAVAWSSGAMPVIVLNKADIDGRLEDHRLAVEAIAPGVAVLVTSAREGVGLDEVRERLVEGRTAIVIGSSGVGKSTLLNALLGTERQATGEVRADDSRGRHTTVGRELVALPGGALLIDTPGLRSLSVAGAEAGMADAFADIHELAQGCRFRDCRHAREPGCAVVAAVEDGRLGRDRLERYQKLEREVAMLARRADPIAAREERRRWAAIGKSVAVHMRTKYGDDGR